MEEPRICIVPEYPLSLMTGGTLVQATETCRALSRHVPQMRFELFNWSEATALADCYHFIGLPKYLAGLCSLVRQSRRPYIVTVLMGADRQGGLASRAAAWRRRAACWLGGSREHQRAIENASRVVAITSTDADAITQILGVPRDRIEIVPVAVSEGYFDAKPDLWVSRYGSGPFVLSVGALQPRKNQLLLARICTDLKLPLVLVGGVLPGQDAYAHEVEMAMSRNEKLGGRRLRCDDALLASAYAACRSFVLLSVAETQPASVLQAMALRKPVLLADAPYARAAPFASLQRVGLEDESNIKKALQKLWTDPSPSALPEEFRWPNVSRRLASLYAEALRK